MARHVLAPHSLGWAKTALEIRKAAAEEHKKNRKAAFKKAGKKFKGLGASFAEEFKGVFTNPWNLFPPIFILNVAVIKPLRGIGALIGFAVSTPTELLKARRESLAMKKGAETMVAYSVFGEMQRNSALKKKITGLVKDDGLKWLYVSKGGQIILSDNPKYSQARLEDKYVLANPPRVDMEKLIAKVNVNYVDAEAIPNHTMVGLSGNTITISKMAQGRSEAARVKSGAIKLKEAKKSEEMIRRDDLIDVKKLVSGIPGKRTLLFSLKDGSDRILTVDKAEADKIYDRMKK